MDYLAVIKRVMDEHRVIADRLKLVGEPLNDQEAVISLESVREDLMVDFKATAVEKQSRLEQALLMLEAGLKNHYAYEEDVLPPLLGETITAALALEHRQLLAEVEQAKSVIRGVRLDELSHEEVLNEEALMYGLLNRIRRQKEEHLKREEAMLLMLQKALEEKAKQPQVSGIH